MCHLPRPYTTFRSVREHPDGVGRGWVLGRHSDPSAYYPVSVHPGLRYSVRRKRGQVDLERTDSVYKYTLD